MRIPGVFPCALMAAVFVAGGVSASSPSDVAPPAVTLVGPPGSTTVAMTVVLAATASADVGVAGVQFYVDGMAIGPEIVSPPYTSPWVTTASSNGLHLISAIARDHAANRTASNVVCVTVANVIAPRIRSPLATATK